jgi:hypothetical protein
MASKERGEISRQNDANSLPKRRPRLTPFSIVTYISSNIDISMTYEDQKSGPEPKMPSRSRLINNANHNEFFGGGQWRGVVSPDGVTCYVTRLWGKESDND